MSMRIAIMMHSLFKKLKRAATDKRGVSAVEFALVAPIFCLLFAVAADFGGVLYVEFRLNGAVSSAANYALLNASSVSSSGGSTLATNLATIVASATGTNWANGSIVVNNGPSATMSGDTIALGGTASNADSCYCPAGSGSSLTWGSTFTCGNSCSAGGLAGKFVAITASRTYTPIFSSYGIVKNGTLSATAVVETQ
jgi:Flp pilus assembly protein TadG